jgi:hypothetical protein
MDTLDKAVPCLYKTKKYLMMNKNIFYILCLLLGTIVTSCFKELDKTFDGDGTFVEFQSTITISPAVGKPYPLIATKRNAGALTTQINLVGNQRTNDETITISIDKANTTAEAGKHFKLENNGKVVIKSGTSTANLGITILDVTPEKGKKLNIVVTLDGNGGDIKPSENYKQIGWTIALD